MFTGIVESMGRVVEAGRELVISADFEEEVGAGESICVDGCCLTHVGGELLRFQLSDETVSRTTLARKRVGSWVNLERALRAGEPMGGHFVMGHVDGIGRLLERCRGEVGEEFWFAYPEGGARYLAPKGCVAVNGVSLTVVKVEEDRFSCWLIPFTLQTTNLGILAPGDEVHLEYDLLARYVERLMAASGPR
jgi:riboflavin synthase